MATTPGWVKRNRFVAWASYCCVLVGFGALAMTLVAAGSGYRGYATAAGMVCAAVTLFGVTLLVSTVHRDHLDHHATPNLLGDSWAPTPGYLRRRRLSRRPM